MSLVFLGKQGKIIFEKFFQIPTINTRQQFFSFVGLLYEWCKILLPCHLAYLFCIFYAADLSFTHKMSHVAQGKRINANIFFLMFVC